jgi:ADP-ribosylglycohydrolase/fructose-1,6-bisphosphatase/inositol monophosphatase family enzyme
MGNVRFSDYGQALEVAVRGAREAADILRRELHRPGGPRGCSGHCESDGDAELIIRRLLDEFASDFGIRGEEHGHADRLPRDAGQHVWLIDPNDGTSAFLRGYRGSAVSIALLRSGTPVLGVVFAFSAPDDAGDLFAWAEGAGPLRRNGRSIAREPLPQNLSAHDIVLVSQAADKNSLANAKLVSPARFRAVPSIAYRLALVAAGDGEAAVSLNGPGDWDYAAGHALLRGVGGELFDAAGRTITYSTDGRSGCGGRCFGGSSAAAARLAAASWDQVFERRSLPEPELSLVQPTRGTLVPDAAVLTRAQGCLLGQLAGDALGSLVEFQSAEEIARQYPHGVQQMANGGTWNTLAGQPTDDSELALMLARSLVQARQGGAGYNAEAAARAYVAWYNSLPFDVGSTTRQALQAAAEAQQAAEPTAVAARAAANSRSQANGALMRVSPLGIFGASAHLTDILKWASEDAALTHPHAVCQQASAVFAAAIAKAIREGGDGTQIYRFACDLADSQAMNSELVAALAAAGTSAPTDFQSSQGWVLIALQNAFYQLLHAVDLESGVVDTVARGGDTDTNAAITGALLGAVYGREQVPAQWRNCVLSCRPISGLSHVRRPRRSCFWPVDALELAERLLWMGQSATQ